MVEEEESSLSYLFTQIKQAFRKKSLQCHPDLCPPSQRPSAELAFRELAEAYAALSKGMAHWLHAVSCPSDLSFLCMSCELVCTQILLQWWNVCTSLHKKHPPLRAAALAPAPLLLLCRSWPSQGHLTALQRPDKAMVGQCGGTTSAGIEAVPADASQVLCAGGTQHHGRAGHPQYQGSRTRPWQASFRPAAKFSNTGLAFLICIPLAFTGVLLGQ